MLKHCNQKQDGFVLASLISLIGIISILAAAAAALGSFNQKATEQRWSDVQAVSSAVSQQIIDNQGTWFCPTACNSSACPLPPLSNPIVIGDEPGQYDICSCLVPDYLNEMPIDPNSGRAPSVPPCDNYTTSYSIGQNQTTGAITVRSTEDEDISVTR